MLGKFVDSVLHIDRKHVTVFNKVVFSLLLFANAVRDERFMLWDDY